MVSATRRDVLRLAGVAAAACAFGVAPRLADAAGSATPTAAATSANAANGDWPTFGYDYGQTRHVPFSQITKENVKDLGRVWSVDFRKIDPSIPPGNETFPIVVDGVLYATTSYDHVFAFDAKSGKLLWHWKPESLGFFKNFGLNVNRGVAYGEGKVYLLTLDMRLIAIDAKTGKLTQQIQIGDTVAEAKPEFGYYETQAPVFYKGNIYVGSSGSDNGVRGFLMAYKADDLSPAWANPFWTVPPDGQGWRKQGHFHGGGTPWAPVTIDPETDSLYVATGNPSPDYYGAVRPGSNPNTDSMIAIKATTGEQLWVQQSISRDFWDYDMAAPAVLMTATVGGKQRKVVAEGSKAGQWWCWDAATGEVIYDGVPFAKIAHPDPTAKGVLVYPGILGGSNYAPQSYDPTTNHFLICNSEAPVLVKLATAQQVENRARGDIDFGATYEFPEDVEKYGTYVAIDMNTGRVVYSKKTPGMLRSGFTTTGAGLGFFAGTDGDENLHAIDTATGEMLWSFGVGTPVYAAPTIYMVDGQEYVTATIGGYSTSGDTPVESGLQVFALGGDKTQIKPVAVPTGATRPLPTRDQFLTLDPSYPKGAIFNAVAAWDGTLNGFNFSGYGKGDLVITIPQGWSLTINLWNKSAETPHSLMIITEADLKQGKGFQPAFVGASTPNPESGFNGSGVQTLESGPLQLSQAGAYVLACGVPGHAAEGMWDTLKVDPKAKEPIITTPDHGTQKAAPAPETGSAGGMN